MWNEIFEELVPDKRFLECESINFRRKIHREMPAGTYEVETIKDYLESVRKIALTSENCLENIQKVYMETNYSVISDVLSATEISELNYILFNYYVVYWPTVFARDLKFLSNICKRKNFKSYFADLTVRFVDWRSYAEENAKIMASYWIRAILLGEKKILMNCIGATCLDFQHGLRDYWLDENYIRKIKFDMKCFSVEKLNYDILDRNVADNLKYQKENFENVFGNSETYSAPQISFDGFLNYEVFAKANSLSDLIETYKSFLVCYGKIPNKISEIFAENGFLPPLDSVEQNEILSSCMEKIVNESFNASSAKIILDEVDVRVKKEYAEEIETLKMMFDSGMDLWAEKNLLVRGVVLDWLQDINLHEDLPAQFSPDADFEKIILEIKKCFV